MKSSFFRVETEQSFLQLAVGSIVDKMDADGDVHMGSGTSLPSLHYGDAQHAMEIPEQLVSSDSEDFSERSGSSEREEREERRLRDAGGSGSALQSVDVSRRSYAHRMKLNARYASTQKLHLVRAPFPPATAPQLPGPVASSASAGAPGPGATSTGGDAEEQGASSRWGSVGSLQDEMLRTAAMQESGQSSGTIVGGANAKSVGGFSGIIDRAIRSGLSALFGGGRSDALGNEPFAGGGDVGSPDNTNQQRDPPGSGREEGERSGQLSACVVDGVRGELVGRWCRKVGGRRRSMSTRSGCQPDLVDRLHDRVCAQNWYEVMFCTLRDSRSRRDSRQGHPNSDIKHIGDPFQDNVFSECIFPQRGFCSPEGRRFLDKLQTRLTRGEADLQPFLLYTKGHSDDNGWDLL